MLYLFGPKETDFINGDSDLIHNTYDEVVDRSKGFYLKFKIALDKDKRYKNIKKEMIISAHTPDGWNQFRVFDIYNHSNYVEVVATQLHYDLNYKKVFPFVVNKTTAQTALNVFVKNFKSDLPNFKFTSNIKDVHSFSTDDDLERLDEGHNALEILNRIASRWGGELKVDGYNVHLVSKLGKFTNALLYEHKNISEFVDETSMSEIITRIHAVSRFRPEREEGYTEEPKEVTIKVVVDSPLINEYAQVYEEDYTYNDARTRDQLIAWARLKYSTNNVDKPSRSIQVETNIIDGQEINYGDDLVLKYTKHDVDEIIRCVGYQYNPNSRQYISVTLGSNINSLASTITGSVHDSTKNQLSNIEKQVQIIKYAANNVNRVTTGPLPIPDPIEGDMWYYHPEGRPNEVELRIFQDGGWVTIVSDMTGENVRRAIAELETEAEGLAADIIASEGRATEKVNQALTDAKAHAIAQDAALKLSIDAVGAEALEAKQAAQNAYINAVAEAEAKVQAKDTEYQTIFGEYDSEIEAAKTDSQTAKSKAEQALTDVGISTDLAQTAKDLATTAQSDANTAKANASQAKTDAIDALAKARESATNSSGALALAGQAATDVQTAIDTAATAQTDALTAIADAQSALTTAGSADSKAGQAIAKANAIPTTITDIITDKNLVNGNYVDTKVDAVTGAWSQDLVRVEGKIPTEIGGRNLIQDSNFDSGQPHGWNQPVYYTERIMDGIAEYECQQVNGSARLEKDFDALEVGQTYTLTCYAIIPVEGQWRGFVGASTLSEQDITPNTDTFKKHSITFRANSSDVTVRLYTSYAPIGSMIYMDWYKLEKGDIATDWTPAPEDLYSQEEFKIFNAQYTQDVNGMTGRITTVENGKLDGSTFQTFKQSEYQVTADKVASTVERVDTAEGLITTQGTAISQNATAISSKADKTVVDKLSGTVDTHTTEISQNATAITSKAAQTEVDTISGTVSTHTTTLSQHATAISSKAEQTEVDTVKGTVSTNTSMLSQQAKEISARLTQSQVDNLVSDKGYSTVSYVDTQMSATAGAIRTEMTAVEGKIPTQIGGRNYLKSSNLSSEAKILADGEVYNFSRTSPGTTPLFAGLKLEKGNYIYTIMMKKPAGDTAGRIRFHKNDVTITYYGFNQEVDGEWNRVEIPFKVTDESDYYGSQIYNHNFGADFAKTVEVMHPMIEKGDTVTDWTPAPEDAMKQNDFNTFKAEYEQSAEGWSTKLTQIEQADYATKTWSNQTFATPQSVSTQLQSYAKTTDLNGLVTETALANKSYITSSAVNTLLSSYAKTTDLNGLAKVTYVDNQIEATAESFGIELTKVEGKIPTELNTLNLIDGTTNEWQNIEVRSTVGSTDIIVYFSKVGLSEGDEITWSFDYDFGSYSLQPRFRFNPVSRDSIGKVLTGSGRASYTAKIRSGETSVYLWLNNNGLNGTHTANFNVKLRGLHLSKGPIGYGWSQSANDVLLENDFTVFKNSYERTVESINTALSKTAKTTDLNGMVTETSLANKNFVTASSVSTTLSNYAKKTDLNGMVTETTLSTKNFVTAGSMSTTLSNYAQKNGVPTNTQFNTLKNSYDSMVQTIGTNGSKIAQMVMTDSAFQVGITDKLGAVSSYSKSYRVNTANPQYITDLNGNNLHPERSYDITLGTRTTSSVTNFICSLIPDRNGSWNLIVHSQNGTNSNHPYLALAENGQPIVGLYSHSTFYTVEVTITQVGSRNRTAFTMLSDSINLRVAKGEMVGELNIQAGKTLIRQSDNVLMITDTTTYISNATIKSAHIDSLNANKVTGTTADFNTIRAGVLTTDVVTATHIKADNALIDNIFANQALVDRLWAKSIWTSKINTMSLDASRITSGTISTSRLKVTEIVAQGLSANKDSITQLVIGDDAFTSSVTNLTQQKLADELKQEYKTVTSRVNNVAKNDGLNYGTDTPSHRYYDYPLESTIVYGTKINVKFIMQGTSNTGQQVAIDHVNSSGALTRVYSTNLTAGESTVSLTFDVTQSLLSSGSKIRLKIYGYKSYAAYFEMWYTKSHQVPVEGTKTGAISSKITQLYNMINLSVLGKEGALSRIAIGEEGIQIDGKLLHITAKTFIDNAVIKSAMIDTLDATKITTGTLNATKVNVINLDANSISGNEASFIQAMFTARKSALQITGNGITVSKTNGNRTFEVDSSGAHFYSDTGPGAYITTHNVTHWNGSSWVDTGKNSVMFGSELNHSIGIGYKIYDKGRYVTRSAIKLERSGSGTPELSIDLPIKNVDYQRGMVSGENGTYFRNTQDTAGIWMGDNGKLCLITYGKLYNSTSWLN